MSRSQAGDFLGRCLPHLTSLLHFTFSPDGVVLRGNQAVVNVIGRNPVGLSFKELFVDFSDTFHPGKAAKTPEEPFLLHLHTASGMPQSFRFFFERQEEVVQCLGESDMMETGSLRRELVAINHEVSNLARDLHKKNAELAKLNETKNKFLGMAAHDLRNPVGIIMSYCDFLLEDIGPQLDEERRSFLHDIRESSEFMLSLLNDLLDLAKIEAGKIDLRLESTDLKEMIEFNLSLNRRLAQKKEISIVFESSEELPRILIDVDKIRQVLNNLLSNAIKFSPPGSTVRVELFRSGEHATVSISDPGPGIPQEKLDRLFQPFSRVGSKPTGGETTTGLGLAIARKIVTEHQGKVWVKSEVGTGSTFTFSLPFEQPVRAKHQQAPSRKSKGAD